MKLAIFLCLCSVTTLFGRLGDTLDQLEARYGFPKKKPMAAAATLLEGSKEYFFEYSGYHIRCALLPATDGKEYVVREEYSKILEMANLKGGGSIEIRDFELNAILKGESASRTWTKQTAASSEPNAKKSLSHEVGQAIGLTGSSWKRDDGAVARTTTANRAMFLELPQAAKYEAEWKELHKKAVPAF
jgi:hypothetical protein